MMVEEDVHRFHEKFRIPQPRTPRPLEPDLFAFRAGFMMEELSEYVRACGVGDLEKQLDALVDLVYVAVGTSLMHGFDFEEAWDRVQHANMRKVSGVATSRHPMFDVTKPDGWRPPDLSNLVLGHVRPPMNEETR